MNIEEWLKDNQLAIDIWNKKYKFENENFEEWLDRVSGGNEELKDLIRYKKFLPGGRILANRGLQHHNKKVTYSNCYVLAIDEDSIESIYKTCADLARTFSYGGGCGIDISPLRAKDMAVHNAAKTTTGSVSFMNTFSNVSEVIGQNGRRGALMLSIDCTHPDLEEFIDVKNDLNAVTKANISVRITNDFMKAVVNDEDWELRFETENGDVMTKSVKAAKIFRRLAENNYNMAEPGILFWDRIEDYNILSDDDEFKYAGVNPCAEEPLPNGGSCLLGSFNLSSYVYYNYGDRASFDFESFKKDIRKAVKAMNEILDEGLPLHPLDIQKQTVHDYRQIGIGVMGIADMLIKLGLRYDSKEAIEFCDNIGEVLADNALYYSALEARDHGAYPKYNADAVLESYYVRRNASKQTLEAIKQFGLRNSQLLTIAPTGTLSTMLGISGGIEPIFSFSYTRKTQSLHGEDVFYKVYTPIAKNYMDEHDIENEEDLPEFFVTAQTIDPFLRVKMQAAWQKHIDASISSTINLPNIATIDMIEDLYIAAWYEGLKGLTIFRDGCARMGVLTLNDKKDEKHENSEKPKKEQKADKGLKFGDTLVPSDNSLGLKRTILSGCGTMHVNAYFDEETGELREVFLNKGSKGGCVAFTNAVSRLISLLARKGAPVEEIADQLNSVVVCPSYAAARAAGKKVSPGSSCASSIAKALLDMHAEFKLKYMDHDDDEEESIEPEKIDLNKEQVRKEVAGPEYSVCPECKEKTMFYSGGCVSCNNCGYSKCN